MEISLRLQEERKRLGMTQEGIAEKLAATKRSVINWEGGAALPGAEVLARYAATGADVLYVLTGERNLSMPALDSAEQVLLDSYRRCGAQARQNLIQTAALLSAGLSLPAPGKQGGAPRGSAGGQNNVGDNAIQIGSVSGKARVKNR